MPIPRFSVGDDLYVRDPGRHTEAVSITGPVTAVKQEGASVRYVLDAYIARRGGGSRAILEFAEHDLGARPGTPLDQLSGPPGSAAHERFAAIARSWGYP